MIWCIITLDSGVVIQQDWSTAIGYEWRACISCRFSLFFGRRCCQKPCLLIASARKNLSRAEEIGRVVGFANECLCLYALIHGSSHFGVLIMYMR